MWQSLNWSGVRPRISVYDHMFVISSLSNEKKLFVLMLQIIITVLLRSKNKQYGNGIGKEYQTSEELYLSAV